MKIKGHDTTALAQTWFLYLMAKNPEKQVYTEKILYTQ